MLTIDKCMLQEETLFKAHKKEALQACDPVVKGVCRAATPSDRGICRQVNHRLIE